MRTTSLPNVTDTERDAPQKEIIYYALGSFEGTLSVVFFNGLSTIMVLILGMDPLLLGLILAARTFWDGFIDPTIAQISDRTRSRWGRRRPFVLVGGIGRVVLLLAIFLFFPRDESIKTNAQFAAEKKAADEATSAPASPIAQPSPTVPTPASGAAPVAAGSPDATAHAIPPSPDAADIAAASVAASSESTQPVGVDSTSTAPGPGKDSAVGATSSPKKAAPKPGFIDSIRLGVAAFFSDENAYHRTVALYLLVACLLFATISSICDVPYYALGIEICPSYDGRTRVVTYRAMVQKVAGLLTPWVLPFCLLPIFHDMLVGYAWHAVFCIVVGVPATILMVKNTRERRIVESVKKGPNLLQSIWQTSRNIQFLKIVGLYFSISVTNGVFQQIGQFLAIFWVYHGNVLAGSTLNSTMSTFATALSFASLPLVNWACRKLQKHRALRFAVIWMSIGAALKWFVVTPENPYLQLILPFFFSIGISSVFTVLPTMMADVTDLDELENGVRREGMFGAVMSLLTKVLGTIQPVLAAVVLKLSGFDATLGADQAEGVFTRMRLFFSIIPAVLMLCSLVLLWRYPVTREYMERVKEKLIARRAAAAATAPVAGA